MGISRFLNTSGLLALSLVGIAPCIKSDHHRHLQLHGLTVFC